MRGLNLKHFKKVAEDEHTATLKHHHGHSVTIAKRALTKEGKEELSALKLHSPKKNSDHFNQGGQEGELKGTSADSDREYNNPKHGSISEGIDNLKKAFSGSDDKQAAPQPKEHVRFHNADGSDWKTPGASYADGGEVKDQDPKIDPDKAKQMESGAKQPGWSSSWGDNIKHAFDADPEPQAPKKQPKLGFADGGQVDPTAAMPNSSPAEVPQQDTQVQTAPSDPALAKKREIYNQLVNHNAGANGPTSFPDQSFGQDGSAPAKFDASAWNQAEAQYNQQEQAEQAGQQQAQQTQVEENKARVAAGLQPNPVATAPQNIADAQAQMVPNQNGQATAPQANAQQGIAGVPQAPNDPMGIQAQSDAFTKGIGEQKAGLFGEAQALGAQGKQEAGMLQQQVANQQQAMKTYQDHFNQLDTERKGFQQDIQNSHIDPNHWWSEKSTASKAATVVGLILGGIGGQGEQMYKFLVDKDIDAQRAELGKKENLLHYNMEQFHNMKDATDMTRSMQNDILSNKLKQAAAQTQDPIAKSRALQAAGKIDMDSSQMIGQMAMRKSLLTGAQNGKTDPSMVLRAYGAPEAAFKELQNAQNDQSLRNEVLSAYDQIAKLNTLSNHMTSPLQTKSQIEKIKGPLLDKLTKDTSGRVTPETVSLVGDAFSKMTDNPATTAIGRRSIDSLVTQKMHYPLLKQYGIDPMSQTGRYDSNGQSRIQFKPGVSK